MSSEDSSAPVAPKSKQERIRDNQRRSRARRQEYLADLERRLNECHITCREADLQRAAFADLKAENARLRDLLKSAGINPDLVETHGRQDAPQHPQHPADIGAASLRQIKPKLQSLGVLNPPPIVKQVSSSGTCCPTSPYASCCPPQPPVSTEAFQVYDDQYRDQLMAAPTSLAMTVSSTTNVSPGTWPAWCYPQNGETVNTSHDSVFICDTFHVPPNGFLLPDDGNSVQCSVAKDMITQYNPTPEEMTEIVARLATAFTRPSYPGANCRVNNQVLLQILSEMNTKQIQA